MVNVMQFPCGGHEKNGPNIFHACHRGD